MLAFECVYCVNFVTRFTEEIFAFLIAVIFLTDASKKMVMVKKISLNFLNKISDENEKGLELM